MHYLMYEPFVILSACTANQFWRDAVVKSCALKQKLIDLKVTFKVVSGMFNGKPETSYYVPYMSTLDALNLAKEFNQESVLIVNHHREAKLHFTNGSIRELGHFIQGEDDNNYTID